MTKQCRGWGQGPETALCLKTKQNRRMENKPLLHLASSVEFLKQGTLRSFSLWSLICEAFHQYNILNVLNKLVSGYESLETFASCCFTKLNMWGEVDHAVVHLEEAHLEWLINKPASHSFNLYVYWKAIYFKKTLIFLEIIIRIIAFTSLRTHILSHFPSAQAAFHSERNSPLLFPTPQKNEE